MSCISPNEDLKVAVDIHWVTCLACLGVPSHQSAHPNTRLCWRWASANVLHGLSIETSKWGDLIASIG